MNHFWRVQKSSPKSYLTGIQVGYVPNLKVTLRLEPDVGQLRADSHTQSKTYCRCGEAACVTDAIMASAGAEEVGNSLRKYNPLEGFSVCDNLWLHPIQTGRKTAEERGREREKHYEKMYT